MTSNRLWRATAVASVLSLASCGGGRESNDPGERYQPDEIQRVTFAGRRLLAADSLTDGPLPSRLLPSSLIETVAEGEVGEVFGWPLELETGSYETVAVGEIPLAGTGTGGSLASP